MLFGREKRGPCGSTVPIKGERCQANHGGCWPGSEPRPSGSGFLRSHRLTLFVQDVMHFLFEAGVGPQIESAAVSRSASTIGRVESSGVEGAAGVGFEIVEEAWPLCGAGTSLVRGSRDGIIPPSSGLVWPKGLSRWRTSCPKCSGAKPRSPTPARRSTLAFMCQQPTMKRYAASTRLYVLDFTGDPRIAADLGKQHRYNAACCASLKAE